MNSALAELKSHNSSFRRSYRRLTSLQAWRVYIVERTGPPECLPFFLEAQNDGIYSHVLAQMGVWRLALQSLRSCLENCCLYLFYKDHLVELEQWKSGAHRLSFRELNQYFGRHPSLVNVPRSVNGLDQLATQIDVLSQVVHGSALDFRMTGENAFPNLWDTQSERLSLWETNEKRTIEAINLLLVVFFGPMIAGTQQQSLREVVGYSITPAKRATINKYFKVNLSV